MSTPEMPSAPRCRRCNKELAQGQRVEHRHGLYCLECVGHALNGAEAAPTKERRSPAVAVLLSLLPGLGQMYNGQMLKGVLVLGAFLLIAIGEGPILGWEHTGLNTTLLVGLYFWNLFDAYWTAQRINRAELPYVPVGEQQLSLSEVTSALEERAESSAAPAFGVLLIVLGVLFLLNNFGATWLTEDMFWPAVFLALGIWMLVSFTLSRRRLPPVEPAPGERPPSREPAAPARDPSADSGLHERASAVEPSPEPPPPGEAAPQEPTPESVSDQPPPCAESASEEVRDE
ncbi:MAG: hypothetical protein JSV65_01555 [Armatimonadota bacterium]|nr:MAG: hypothetical protein JSV65_01555 [Armatimonadota bacterium]